MFSSWNAWDYFSTKREFANDSGVYCLKSFDTFIEKIILDTVDYSDSQKIVKIADEVSVDFLVESIESLDLFSTHKTLLVLFAEQLSNEVKEYILSDSFSTGDNRIILVFSNKEKGHFLSLKKNSKFSGLEIEPPKFWEVQKLLDLLMKITKVWLNYDCQQVVLEYSENDCGTLINLLKKIGLNFKDTKTVTPEQIKEAITNNKIDQFYLASFFSQKRLEDYYKDLFYLRPDFESLRSIGSFMQGHITRLLDPSYIDKKPRASKYDKEIQAGSRLWSKEELELESNFFNEIELMAKSKSPFIMDKIRIKYLESYK